MDEWHGYIEFPGIRLIDSVCISVPSCPVNEETFDDSPISGSLSRSTLHLCRC